MECLQVARRGQGACLDEPPHVHRRGRRHHYRVPNPGGVRGSGEFSVAGYTTFAPTPSLQGGKTLVVILLKSDLAVRANVKVIDDLMDPAVQ
jgi:hypothetical protein